MVSATRDARSAADRQIIGDVFTSDSAHQLLLRLCDECGNRFAGSASERKAADVIAETMRKNGLENVHLEPLEITAWTRGTTTLRMMQPMEQTFSALALPYSPACDLTAEMIDCGGGEEEDFQRLGDAVNGKIAVCAAETGNWLSARRVSHRTDKYRWAVAAGAVGFIFINQNPGQLRITGSLYPNCPIPGVGVSLETGSTILRLAKRGEHPTLHIEDTGTSQQVTTYNVVGELPGDGSTDEFVLTGAHYDAHDIAVGAADDGAGTCVLVEAGRALANVRNQLVRGIRFIAFAAEEVGLNGAWAYRDEHERELRRCRYALNLDGAGQGQGGSEVISLTGTPELVPYFQNLADEFAYRFDVVDRFAGHSDHFPFALAGVPAGTLSSKDSRQGMIGRGWGHTEADTVDKVSLRGLQMGAILTARILLQMSTASESEWPGHHRTAEEMRKMVEENDYTASLTRSGRMP
jgi:Iap family predicted aminopeptidase